jgi:signal transduction histidine kinase
MWTRLLAGAAAHDINNLTQSLFNLLALAGSPNASREALGRYDQLARDGLKQLERLSADLHALAHSDQEARAQRVDLVCADVLAETEPPPDRTLTPGAMSPTALVRGTGAALRLAVQAPVRYGLAASRPGGTVRLAVEIEPDTVAVVLDAPDAATALGAEPQRFEEILTGRGRELRGDFGLVLAGAIVQQYGGELRVGRGAVGGLCFKINLPRAEEVAVDARSTEGPAPRSGRR